MPSTPSPRLRVMQQAKGEGVNSWGDPNLNNALLRLEEGAAGVATIALTGTAYTLNVANYVADEARMAVLVFTGTLTPSPYPVTAPPVQKVYDVDNRTNQPLLFTSGASGTPTTATVRAGLRTRIFCDGTNFYAADPRLDQIAAPTAAVNMNGQQVQGAADGTANNHLATVGQVPAVAATQVQLASDWAQKTSGSVDGGTGYSARLWATSTTALTGGFKGAYGYAQDAAASATNSANSATASAGSASAASTSATNAGTSETNAASSATLASQQAARLAGSSVTSNAIGTGSKAFTTQSGKFFDPGTRLLISSDANPATNTMFGIVTAYSGTALTVNVTAFTGAGTYGDWTLRVAGERGAIGPAGSNIILRSPRTSNTQLVSADGGYLIEVTAGTFSQTFAAAATLGSGWWIDFKNSGPGVITLDPNGSETIDGKLTLNVYPGEAFVIQCDASSLRTVGRPQRVKIGDVVLSSAVSAVDFELFSGDAELLSIDFEALAMTNGGIFLFKKNGAYITATSSYAYQTLQGSGSSVFGNSGANTTFFPSGEPTKGSIINIGSTAASAVRLFNQVGSGGASLTVATQTESTAGPFQGLRFFASPSFGVGSAFRVWGNR